MQLFEFANRHRAWLAQSQSVVAQNISNENTPNYKARRIQDFAEVLRDVSPVHLAATQPGHMAVATEQALAIEEMTSSERATHSGNSVDLDRELLKAGEIRSGYALNASIVKTFGRMVQASVRG